MRVNVRSARHFPWGKLGSLQALEGFLRKALKQMHQPLYQHVLDHQEPRGCLYKHGSTKLTQNLAAGGWCDCCLLRCITGPAWATKAKQTTYDVPTSQQRVPPSQHANSALPRSRVTCSCISEVLLASCQDMPRQCSKDSKVLIWNFFSDCRTQKPKAQLHLFLPNLTSVLPDRSLSLKNEKRVPPGVPTKS